MRTLREFFESVWRSMTDRAWLATAGRKRPLGRCIGYLFVLLMLLSFISIAPTAGLLMAGSNAAERFVGKVLTETEALYPAGLVLTLKDNTLSTNATKPVTIEYPPTIQAIADEARKDEKNKRPIPAHFVVIDVDAHVEDYMAYDTLVLLTQSAAAFPKEKNEVGFQVVPYSDMQEEHDGVQTPLTVELTSEKVAEGFAALRVYVPYINAVLLCVGFLFFTLAIPLVAGAWLCWKLLTFFFIAFLLWLLALAASRPWTYGQLYRACCYGVTSSVLLGKVLAFFTTGYGKAPFILFMVWMAVTVLHQHPAKKANVRKAKKS